MSSDGHDGSDVLCNVHLHAHTRVGGVSVDGVDDTRDTVGVQSLHSCAAEWAVDNDHWMNSSIYHLQPLTLLLS